jgi:hypothetical protein
MNKKTTVARLRPLFYDNLHKIVDHLPSGKHGKFFLLSIMKREKICPLVIEACLGSDFLIFQKKYNYDNSIEITFYNSF